MAGTIEDLEGVVPVVKSEDGHLETAGSRGAVMSYIPAMWNSQPRKASTSVTWKVWVEVTQSRSFILLVRGYTEN